MNYAMECHQILFDRLSDSELLFDNILFFMPIDNHV